MVKKNKDKNIDLKEENKNKDKNNKGQETDNLKDKDKEKDKEESNDQDIKEEKESVWDSFFSFENLKSLLILIVIVFAVRWSIISPYKVPTPSMEPTIKVGDRLMANKLSFKFIFPFTHWVVVEWSKPQRGDIIVFRYPKDPSLDYVKRVVAVAGDSIFIKDNVLYVNGEAQDKILKNSTEDRKILEDILDHKDSKVLYQEKVGDKKAWVIHDDIRGYRSDWPINGLPYTVEKDSVFVMGDNRDNSSDSRVWGEVPLSYVVGKAMFVIFSKYKPDGSNHEWTFRWNRIGHRIK